MLTGWWCFFGATSPGIQQVRRLVGTYPNFTSVPEDPGEGPRRGAVSGSDAILGWVEGTRVYQFRRFADVPNERSCNR